jgi:hypothetical protein
VNVDFRGDHLALVGNRASLTGGGVFVGGFSGVLTLRDARVAANSATNAAGIYVAGIPFGGATASLERVAIDGNIAGSSIGAIGSAQLTGLRLRNVDVYGNRAAQHAGVLIHGWADIAHATIAGNVSPQGVDALHVQGLAFYRNSILAGRCTGDMQDITAQGRNLRFATPSPFDECPGTTTTAAVLALQRGHFGGLFPVSGTDEASSAIVDAGAGAHCLADDVRGAARDPRCDIGAFEFGAVP